MRCACKDQMRFKRHELRCPMACEEPLGAMAQGQMHHRRGYPLAGCSPAEPASVSPGGKDVSQARSANKSNQRRCHGHDSRTGCSDGSLVFCLDNGVHFTLCEVGVAKDHAKLPAG